ncbi:MAG: hydroxymethylbilane synthase, partial [Pseudomonadota bacterium]
MRLGTRRSALAWVQSSQVAQALRDAHPGLEIELVGIDTRGDRITDVPLSGVEGKEFFTAEIDAALLESRVDMTVHSLKDLSLDRPAGLTMGAIPRRANPRDIAIFAPDTLQRLAEGKGLRIGTASPRRAQLLPAFLSRALPHAANNTITLEPLRGNVDSRLRRLREPRDSTRQLDGVVLAIAGLSRLFADRVTERQGNAMLTTLLDGLPLMLLPLTDCPAAPGQGALAIECRSDDAETRRILASLDHAPTRNAITAERAVLAEYGGGCHQRFGATHLELPGLGGLLQIAGLAADGRDIAARRWLPGESLAAALAAPRGAVQSWDGSRAAPPAVTPLIDAVALAGQLHTAAVYIAHSRALPDGAATALKGRRVWTSGSASWFRLAAQGVWVEGCLEGRGADAALSLLSEPVLRLPYPSGWTVLTHGGAEDNWTEGDWRGAKALATYSVAEGASEDRQAMAEATHIYWSSVAQFERGKQFVARSVHHASGPGRTAEHLRRSGVEHFQAFPSVQEWQRWIAKAP